jgi:NAD(P)-dependent dehydrogenase (short-subunit alcohol dehydrogenase family)
MAELEQEGLEARTALVTGANRGLGLETARQLASRGFRVLLTSRNEQEGLAAARRIADQGRRVDFRPLDVTSDRSVAALGDQLRKEEIALDVLVNNAGVSLKGFNVDVVRQTLDVNFFGALRVTDQLLPLLKRGGNLVMVSSGLGELSGVSPQLQAKFGDPHLTRDGLVALVRSFAHDVELGRHAQAGWPSSAYRVSKIGLNTFVRIVAPELEAKGIRVNAVCPGWVRTDMGGSGAERGVDKGAASIVWAATLKDATTGGFFRDGKAIAW